jgi:adenosylhomocysteinase
VAGELGSAATRGIARIEWADRSMPVLAELRRRFSEAQTFRGIRIGACLHITPETANLLRAFTAGGAEVWLAASNPLSTQPDAAAALGSEYGVNVSAEPGEAAELDAYYRHISVVLDAGPDLVLDDGCDLISTLHTQHADRLGRVRAGCEATSGGVVRLRAMQRAGALRIPVVAMHSGGARQLLDGAYGTGQSTIDAVLRSTNALLAGARVVVAGYGSCGRGVAESARGLGASVIVTEVDPLRALEAAMSGFTVLPMEEAARHGDVFITVTGNRDVVGARHFAVMRDGAIVANAGHFDVEVDVRWLAANAVDIRRGIRPNADEYVLPDRRRLVLLAQGRVVNLAAAEGHPPSVMDVSFATQALTVAWLVEHAGALPAGVHDLPAGIDEEVARLKLAALGVAIDSLSPAQTRYLSSWESSWGDGAG